MQIRSQIVAAQEDYNRVPVGIQGFDELINGGLIPSRTYVVMGPSGSGKTTFGMHFLANGALRYNENGVFVTLEEEPLQLRQDLNSVGIKLDQLESCGKLVTLDASSSRIGIASQERHCIHRPYTLDSMIFEIQKCVKAVNAKRLVLDCVDAMELDTENEDELRKTLIKLRFVLRSLNCTCLIIAESREPFNRERIEQFTSDGVIFMTYRNEECKETIVERNTKGENLHQDTTHFEIRSRKIEVLKMRGTNHSPYVHSFTISDNGIQVQPRPTSLSKTRLSMLEFKPTSPDSLYAGARWYQPPSRKRYE